MDPAQQLTPPLNDSWLFTLGRARVCVRREVEDAWAGAGYYAHVTQTSQRDEGGVIAGQQLFNVYVHTHPDFAFQAGKSACTAVGGGGGAEI